MLSCFGIYFRLHLLLGHTGVFGKIAGHHRSPKCIVFGKVPFVHLPLVGILAEHQLVKCIIHHIFPALAGQLLLYKPPPAIVTVAVDVAVKNWLCLGKARDILSVLVYRRGQYVAQVTVAVVHVIGAQAPGMGLPGPFQYYAAFLVLEFFHGPCIAIGLLPVLVLADGLIKFTGLVSGGIRTIIGTVQCPELYLSIGIGAITCFYAVVIGSARSGLPACARGSLLQYPVQRARFEYGLDVGIGRLCCTSVPAAAGLVEQALVGYPGRLIAAVGSGLLGIGQVFFHLPAQGIILEYLYQVPARGTPLPLHRLQRTAQPVKILDTAVGLAYGQPVQ
ncbi:hypothetical protein MMF97_08910 [Pedobacter sp. CYS-01]|uniref:Uncharacterized protein n=1 Tax=Pedobacter montanisoli TaxID=2923277 RepID=A0ABS9ZX03_9SPHI|nr:hypothetical protein [Pedobacter montanisoli]MCJ0742828.1 hypothetical protein [Pedobacter montanisoli]